MHLPRAFNKNTGCICRWAYSPLTKADSVFKLLSEAAELYYVVWTVVKFTHLAQPMRQALQVSTNQTHITQIKAN
jgi:hypothetical protein